MTYYALSFTALNDLTFNRNVNKYAHDRRLWTFSSQCRYIQCWTGPEQHRSKVLEALFPFCFFSSFVAVFFNRKPWQLLVNRRCLSLVIRWLQLTTITIKATVHLNPIQLTGLLRVIEGVRDPRTAPRVGSGLRLCWRHRCLRGPRFAAVAAM